MREGGVREGGREGGWEREEGREGGSGGFAHLVDHELGGPLSQSTVGAVQNHLQHISVHLLHHHINLGRG